MNGRTLVLGASLKLERYSNLAVRRLVEHGFPVFAVGRREGYIGDVPVLLAIPSDAEADTVTLYLNPSNQLAWRARIMALHPRRVIFNPGAEDPGFAATLSAQGIEVMDACTLVMLASRIY